MSGHWPPRLDPGARGGIREASTLPGQAELARLDPASARSVILAGPASKAELLHALAAGLGFPAWFGHNWDALEELLRAPEPADDRAIVIVWHHPERLAAADAALARDVFRSAATGRRASGLRPLVVFVGAPGAEAGQEGGHGMAIRGEDVPDAVRRIGRIHHVAVVVRSIDAALPLWRDFLGLRLETVMDIAHDRVRIAFLGAGESKIELVEPTDDTTGVARFLAAKGEGFHHVCLEVGNLAETLIRLAIDGLELIDSAPRRGAEGPVAFIHPRSCQGVLVELIEAPGGPAWAQLGFGGG